MAIRLACSCGQFLQAPDTAAGQTYPCPNCRQIILIPAMGIIERSRGRHLRSAPVESAGRNRWRWLLGLVVFLLLSGTAAWYAVSYIDTLTTPKAVAELAPEPIRINEETPPIARVIPPLAAPPTKVESKVELAPPPNPVADPPTLTKPIALDPPAVAKPIILDPPAKKPALIGGPLLLEWKLRESESFVQELVITQKPTFQTQGVTFNSLLQYRVVSRFTVDKALAEGGFIVKQKVEEAKLLQADALTQGLLSGAIAKLPGTVFTVHLDDKIEVTKFEGAVDGPQFAAPKVPAGPGLQMASLMDMDAWKEMAHATFFQYGHPLVPKARWSKPMTHNWGPLGAWAGTIHYAYSGRQKDLHKVDYKLELAYQPPKAGATIMATPIQGAKFAPPEAVGSILFDAAGGKVIALEERFLVRGQITLSLLGQNAIVSIQEEQHFLMRIK